MYPQAKKLKQPESETHGYEYALFLLNIRLRTEGEIRNKMRERGYVQTVIDAVVQQLIDNKYVDDVRFAELLIDNFKKYKSYGYMQIKKKLMEKRLPMQRIEQSLDELYTIDDELAVAKRFLAKEKIDAAALVTQEQKAKAARKLQSRGFRGVIITRLIFSS